MSEYPSFIQKNTVFDDSTSPNSEKHYNQPLNQGISDENDYCDLIYVLQDIGKISKEQCDVWDNILRQKEEDIPQAHFIPDNINKRGRKSKKMVINQQNNEDNAKTQEYEHLLYESIEKHEFFQKDVEISQREPIFEESQNNGEFLFQESIPDLIVSQNPNIQKNELICNKQLFNTLTLRKNTNMPKVVSRYFYQYVKHYKEMMYSDYSDYYQNILLKILQNLQDMVNTKVSVNLNDLEQFLNNQFNQNQSRINRLTMRKILSRYCRRQIIANDQVKMKMQYLVAAKLFNIRCASKILIKRMKMK